MYKKLLVLCASLVFLLGASPPEYDYTNEQLDMNANDIVDVKNIACEIP